MPLYKSRQSSRASHLSSAGGCLFTLALLGWPSVAVLQPQSYESGRAQFAADMVARHGFDADALGVLLDRATYRQEIIDAMGRPYESKPWHRYRLLFLTPERIAGGVSFWRQNAEVLSRAEDAYGVPPEIIVSILGVETSYGRRLGSHRVLDALTTLGFSYPKRADFFQGELEQLLLLNQEGQVDALAAKGSYAGALGQPQFIPSSYRAYAVDFDQDGKRDLWSSNADVVGSVANYLKRHGWRRDEPVAFPVRVSGTLPADLAVGEKSPIAPNTSVDYLRSVGVEWQGAGGAEMPATLLRLDGEGDEYWVALENFYVITRYNHSNLYAMAVYQLAQAIRERYESGT